MLLVKLCKNKKCCPEIHLEDNGTFTLGSDKEGTTIWTKEHLQDFVTRAKNGEFDPYIK